MRIFLIILLAKLIASLSRLLNLGAGGTWPGELALMIKPDILDFFANQISQKTILVAGTNGKTTTVKIISEILRNKETKILRNDSGGNVLNGIISTLITHAAFSGQIKTDYLILEVDEATLPLVARQIKPKVILLLNLFRDQLDRYGEVNTIAEKWLTALKRLPKETTFILNADDPVIAYLGRELAGKKYYFGLNDKNYYLNQIPHAVDSLYCPVCKNKLNYQGVFLSHLGDWQCLSCNFKKPKLDLEEKNCWFPLEGVYNRYNTLAAMLTGKILGIDQEKINQVLKNFQPAFGRQEEFEIDGRKIKIYLSKNPTGMNETIRTVIQNQKSRLRSPKTTYGEASKNQNIVLLVLNDRIPDGRDVSWIWDVDTEELLDSFDSIIISGDRAYDMGLRIKYSNKIKNQKSQPKADRPLDENISSKGGSASGGKNTNQKLKIFTNLKEAIKFGIETTENEETLYILPTYSGMLEVRKILTGRKIL